jgi:hypothetical protein
LNANGYGVGTDNWYITDAKGHTTGKGMSPGVLDPSGAVNAMVTANLSDGTAMWTRAHVTLPGGPTDPIVIDYGDGITYSEPHFGMIISGDCQHLFFGTPN